MGGCRQGAQHHDGTLCYICAAQAPEPAAHLAKGTRHCSAQAALSCASFSFMRWKRFLIADFDHLGDCKIP